MSQIFKNFPGVWANIASGEMSHEFVLFFGGVGFLFLVFCFCFCLFNQTHFDGILGTSCQEVQVPSRLTLGDCWSRQLGSQGVRDEGGSSIRGQEDAMLRLQQETPGEGCGDHWTVLFCPTIDNMEGSPAMQTETLWS